jgi:hypothetical protein
MRITRSLTACLAIAAMIPHSAGAQTPDNTGLTAALAFTRTSLELDGAAARVRNGPTINVGYRFCALCSREISRVSFTPTVALAFTDIRGVNRARSSYAFSRLDLGAQLAVRIGTVRLFGTASFANKRTAELARDSLNYLEPSAPTTLTGGVEFLCTKEGRGLILSFTPLSGTFTEAEDRLGVYKNQNLKYRGWAASIGWSGPFTGAGLPWR